MLPIRTILHPTDFSEQAQHAFAAACLLARDHGSRVVVLYVRAPTTVASGEIGPVVPDPVWTPADVRAALEALHLPDAGVEVEYCVAEGEPAEKINRTASETKANLMVMGTHGRTGLRAAAREAVQNEAVVPVVGAQAQADDFFHQLVGHHAAGSHDAPDARPVWCGSGCSSGRCRRR
jgi:nucleotide-binding universal stress UspA family protein